MIFHFYLSGSSKVSNFNNSILVQQNVCAFQISVNDGFLMQVIQSLKYLFTYFWSIVFIHRSILFQVVFETSILNELKNDLNFFIVRTDIETVVLDDIGMI